MSERVCVFVDGENFRHAITKLFEGEFDKAEYLPKKAQWTQFFDWIVMSVCGENATRLRTYWYVVQNMDFFPYKFLKPDRHADTLKRLLSRHADYKDELDLLSGADLQSRMTDIVKDLQARRNAMRNRFDGWTALQNGITTKHTAIEFRRAGSIRFDLFKRTFGLEKAVDVKLATDLIMLRDIYDTAVLISGDQDYVPAVQVVKDSGKRVVNVAFKTRGGKLLPGGAWRLNHVTDHSHDIDYQCLKTYLRIGSSTGG